MHTYTSTSENITVTVTQEYVPARSDPDSDQFMFYYHVTITNNSSNSIVVLSRDLTIKESSGSIWKNEGSGLLGEQPLIRSNGSYHYTSFMPLHSPTGSIRGKLLVSNGEMFEIEFPLVFFRME